jgi:hypothetical protein
MARIALPARLEADYSLVFALGPGGPENRPGKKVLSGCHFSKTAILGVLLA